MAHSDRKQLGRPAYDGSNAGCIIRATGATPQTVRQHCDHPEGDSPLPWNERHCALCFGSSLLVEVRGFTLFAAAQEFPRSLSELRAPTVMIKPRHVTLRLCRIMPRQQPTT